MDSVHPTYEPSFVFECKYELDSLAAFLSLGNQLYANTGSKAFLTKRYYRALERLLEVLGEQAMPTFNKQGEFDSNTYTFQRQTAVGTETLNLRGMVSQWLIFPSC
jgi:meiotically up-regulated gene 157 (Mug157) protein